MHPFHLAFPVDDLAAARRFYGDLLGCREGRSSDRWIDFDFFGHQIVAHLVEGLRQAQPERDEKRDREGDSTAGQNPLTLSLSKGNPVDGDDVPVPHFGAVLDRERFDRLAERLTEAGTQFLIPPRTRFAGQPGEQSTMFLRDPAGNALEFKAMADAGALFRKGPE